jgi:tetratricopeptide (TPR) repeat protein
MNTATSGLSTELAATAGRRVRLVRTRAGEALPGDLRDHASATGAFVVTLSKHASFARFTSELVQTLATSVVGIQRTFAGAYARALQMPDPSATLAAWFARHLPSKSSFVIGGLHRAGDPRIARFIIEAIERLPQSSWSIASQTFDALPVATWLARGIAAPPIDGSAPVSADASQHTETPANAEALEAQGDVAGALQLLLEGGREAEMVELIDRHGFALIESDSAYLLHDALANLSEKATASSPVVLTLLAMTASLGDRFDVSEAHFKAALGVCRDDLQRGRVSYWYGSDLLRRGQSAAIALLQAARAAAPAGSRLSIASTSALAAALAVAGRVDEASELAESGIASVRGSNDDGLTARVRHQAAYVALRACRYSEAKEFATQALMLAENVGAYETIAGAASVLYNVALDVDEELGAAVAFLRRIADCGAKCGNVEKQFYGLVAAYEIEVERGDDDTIAGLESDLAEFDAAYQARCTTEGLLPSQVLQMAWHGEFERAYEVLSGSRDQQNDAGRRGQRWAELALYAAAARATDDAGRAIAAARRQLRAMPPSSVHHQRTRAYLALAQILAGRPQAARTEIATLLSEPIAGRGRLRALIDTIGQLAAWHVGAIGHVDLLAGLERLRGHEFGGFARMLEALPADLLYPEPADPQEARSA